MSTRNAIRPRVKRLSLTPRRESLVNPTLSLRRLRNNPAERRDASRLGEQRARLGAPRP